MNFKNLISFQAYFSNELACAKHLELQRWNGKPECPHCGSEHHYRTKTRFKDPELADYKDFYCKACMKKYTVLTGTVYEKSKISLKAWFAALYLLSSHKKGISSLQLSRDIGVTQKTAWFMLHRLRKTLIDKAPEVLDGVVSIDEAFVGGKMKNRHKDKRIKYQKREDGVREFKDKTPVFGIMQYGGPVRCFVIPDTTTSTLQPLIYSNIARGTTLYTDEYRGYGYLGWDYDRHVVEHGRGQYRNGYATTNNIEGFWSLFKRGILGMYHYVSRKHLQRYCDEFCFRYNTRQLTDPERFDNALRNCNELRITYKTLTG